MKINNVAVDTLSAASDASSPFLGLQFAYVDATAIQAKVDPKLPEATARILMFDSAGNLKWFTFTGTQNIDLDTDGVNGLETVCKNAEGEEANHNYHVYAVGTSAGTVGFLFVDTDDYSDGPFGGGWALPSGYTYCSLPAWYVRNNGSSNILTFSDSNGYCAWEAGHGSQTIVSNGSATSYTDVTADLQKYAPPWAQVAKLRVWVGSGGTVNLSHNGSTNTLDTMGAVTNYEHAEWAGGSSLHYKRATANTYIQCQGWQR